MVFYKVHGFIEIVMNLNVKQMNYGWIKATNFTTALCKNC